MIKTIAACFFQILTTICFAQTNSAKNPKPGIFDAVFDTSYVAPKDTLKSRPNDPISNYLDNMVIKIMPFINFVEGYREKPPTALDKYAKAEALEKKHPYEALKLYDALVHEEEQPMLFMKIGSLVERLKQQSGKSSKAFLKETKDNPILLKWAYYNFALDELFLEKPKLTLTIRYLNAAIAIDSTIPSYKMHHGIWSYYTGDYKQSILDLENTQAGSGIFRSLVLCCLADSYASLNDTAQCKNNYQLFQSLKLEEKIDYIFIKTNFKEFVMKSTGKVGEIKLEK